MWCLLRASWAFPAPLGGICPGRLLRAAGFWGICHKGKPGFNNPANSSLLCLLNLALIWDFFLFSLGRKMIKTRPGNPWSRRGLYLLGKGAAPANVLVMPQPLFTCTTLDFPALSKEIPGKSRLSLLFKSDSGQIIFSCARQDFFLKEYPIFCAILQITQPPKLCSGWRPAHSWCLFASQIKAPSSGGISLKINSLGKLGFSNCLVHLVHYCPSPALIQTTLTVCLWRALQSPAYPHSAGDRNLREALTAPWPYK